MPAKKIRTIEDVFAHFGSEARPGESLSGRNARLSLHIYKGTECGAWAHVEGPSVAQVKTSDTAEFVAVFVESVVGWVLTRVTRSGREVVRRTLSPELQAWLNVARETPSGPWKWAGDPAELLALTPQAESPDGYVVKVDVEALPKTPRCVTVTSRAPTYRMVKCAGTFLCGSIVEGSEAEIRASPVHLPCTSADLDHAVKWVDDEARAAWMEANGDEDAAPTLRDSVQRIMGVLTETGDAERPDGLDDVDPALHNADRADNGETAARAYAAAARFKDFDADAESIVQDLVNDLCHFARARDISVERVLASAYLSFRTEETNEAEGKE